MTSFSPFKLVASQENKSYFPFVLRMVSFDENIVVLFEISAVFIQFILYRRLLVNLITHFSFRAFNGALISNVKQYVFNVNGPPHPNLLINLPGLSLH